VVGRINAVELFGLSWKGLKRCEEKDVGRERDALID
jgi:hypothetical protein